MSTPNFEVGEVVRDTFTGKTGVITIMDFDTQEGTWYYSIDRHGWKYLPECDLESMEPKGEPKSDY